MARKHGVSVSKMAEELSKIGMHAGPSTSCDARPGASTKPKRKSPSFKRTEPVAVVQLAAEHGTAKAADMLGVSDSGLATMISRKDVSLTIEKLAEMIILNGGQTLQRQEAKLFVTRVPRKHVEVVATFLNALGINHKEFSE